MSTRALAVSVVGLAASLMLPVSPVSPVSAVTSAGAPPGATKVIGNCQTPRYKPHRIILACGDAGAFISRATYSHWQVKSAAGRGRYYYNTCTPTCAGGHLKHHPIDFTLFRKRTVKGQPLFTRVRVAYAGLDEVFQLPEQGV
jgi:hypothetical protein